MALKLIKSEDFKFGIITFKGDPIENYIFDKGGFNMSGGLEERIATWLLPLEDKVERFYGTEHAIDLRDFPRALYPSTPILNKGEVDVSSFTVGLESLSLKLFQRNSGIRPETVYVLQKELLKNFDCLFKCETDPTGLENSTTPIIIDLISVHEDHSEEINLMIRDGKLFRLPGTCFAILSKHIQLKHTNEREAEFHAISKEKLLKIAHSEIKFVTTINSTFIEMLSEKPPERFTSGLNKFINKYSDVDLELVEKRVTEEAMDRVKIGVFLRDPTA